MVSTLVDSMFGDVQIATLMIIRLMTRPIGQLHVSKNILINCLIVLTSRLDALDACKNVLQPMGIQRSTGIKQLSQAKHKLCE